MFHFSIGQGNSSKRICVFQELLTAPPSTDTDKMADKKNQLLSLIKQVVLLAGDFRFAEVEELQLIWDGPSTTKCKDNLNLKLEELWREITGEENVPEDLKMEEYDPENEDEEDEDE